MRRSPASASIPRTWWEWADDPCPCGRTFRLLKGGIVGRADEITNVKGVLLAPSAIEEVIRGIDGLGDEYEVIVEREGDLERLSLKVELLPDARGDRDGTAAVRVTPSDMEQHMPGAGPRIAEPVAGRHGGTFHTFGDYSIDLFRHIDLDGDPPSRALFDMAAVAIVKNPAWATPVEIPAPVLTGGVWRDRPENPRHVVIWERFDRAAILADFFRTMRDYVLGEGRAQLRWRDD